MTISYPLDIPTSFGFSTFSYGLDHAVGVSETEFSFEQQVQEHQGTAWEIVASIELLNRNQMADYIAFIHALNGRKGTFTTAIPGHETPLGSASVTPGTPVIAGGSQTGNEIDIDGLPTSVTGYLLEGDFVQIGTNLHQCVENVDTNGSGEATLVLAPKVVTAPSDNDPVTVSNAKGIFRLKQNLNLVDLKPPLQTTISFSARESK